jgi:glutamine synthetase
VLTPVELESRYEVQSEQYVLAVEVEARLAVQIARSQVYPAAVNYLGKLAQAGVGGAIAEGVASLAEQLVTTSGALQNALDNPPHGSEAHMRHCADTLLPQMLEVRKAVDALEALVDDDLWPLPSYQEMLFVR